jgi:hypothetical protein
MKNLLTLLVGLTTLGLQAQISTFDLDRSTLVYINYMPGEPGYEYNYNYPSDFANQWNDLIEVGAIIPLWQRLNANVGIGATFNFQEPELFSRQTYSPTDPFDYMGSGLHLKTGLSYGLQIGNLKIMPNLGVVFNTEKSFYWERLSDDLYELTEGYTGLWGVFDAGIDVVYKDILIGLTYTDLGWNYSNYNNIGIKLGYAFKNKSKMNF